MTKEPRRVAVLATALATLPKAPVKDPSWEFWGVGPAIFPFIGGDIPRMDRWFELHHPYSHPDTTEYWNQLPEYKGEVWTFEPRVKGNVRQIPRDILEDIFGTWFFRGTVAWMLALAIHEMRPGFGERIERLENGDAIGLYGVEAAFGSEYEFEKFGILHFIDLATRAGIEVHVPTESELLVTKPPYPGDETTQILVTKLNSRRKMIDDAMKELDGTIDKSREMRSHLKGALEELEKVERHIL